MMTSVANLNAHNWVPITFDMTKLMKKYMVLLGLMDK